MKARDVMSSPVITVHPEAPLREAVRRMLDNHVSGLPVVAQTGRLVGIVTEGDLVIKAVEPPPPAPFIGWHGRSLALERLVSGHRKARGRTVGEVMTRNVVTADPDTPVRALASLMVRHQVNRIPIVRDGRLVGIVTRADVLKAFLRPDPELAAEAGGIAATFALPGEELAVSVAGGVLNVQGRLDPSRANALLRRLEQIDGLIAIDDTELAYTYPARVPLSE